MKFVLIFLATPVVELYFLIKVGGVLGAGPTIALVLLTAAAGVFLVRAQGLSAVMRVQKLLAAGQSPALEMLEGMLLFIAGAMLLVPGFFTDAIGFALLTPPLRRRLIHYGIERWRRDGSIIIEGEVVRKSGREHPNRPAIEADYREVRSKSADSD